MNPTQNQTATPEPADITPADLLRAAALYLERHGWTQGTYFDFDTPRPTPTPPACALGAIHIATFGTTSTEPVDLADYDDPDVILRERAHQCLAGHIELDIDWPWMTVSDRVTTWNDRYHRTASEVIDAFRAAADEWDRIHGGAR